MTTRLDSGSDAAWVSLDLSFSSLSSYINKWASVSGATAS